MGKIIDYKIKPKDGFVCKDCGLDKFGTIYDDLETNTTPICQDCYFKRRKKHFNGEVRI